MHGTFSTRGKQSKPFFKSNFLYLWHFTIVLPNLKTSPHPLACIFSHFLLGLICLSPAQISKAMASTGQASYDFKTSLFSSSPVILFFHHLSHTTLHLLNCPILLQHPSSLVLKQFSAFNHWCQLNFSSCSSYTCSRQNCWMTWKKKILFSISLRHNPLLEPHGPEVSFHVSFADWGLMRSWCQWQKQ